MRSLYKIENHSLLARYVRVKTPCKTNFSKKLNQKIVLLKPVNARVRKKNQKKFWRAKKRSLKNILIGLKKWCILDDFSSILNFELNTYRSTLVWSIHASRTCSSFRLLSFTYDCYCLSTKCSKTLGFCVNITLIFKFDIETAKRAYNCYARGCNFL